MFNNLKATLKKVIVIFLIITLTYANLILIGSNIVNGLISYAAEGEEEQPTLVANQELVMNQICEIDGEEKRVIQVAVETGIESEEYPIKEATLTLSTEIVEGNLEDVRVTKLNKNSYTSGTFTKTEDGKLLISLVNENETLETKNEGLDKLFVTCVFQNSEIETIKEPLEKVEVKAYSEEVLTNEYVETYFEDINVEKDLLLLNIENKDIHKTTIVDGQVEYSEKLKLDLSYRKETSSITIEDVSNDFYDNDEQKNEEVSLKYKTTTINKEDLLSLLGDEGKLTITDIATSKILVELTSDVLSNQELDVKTEQKFTTEETSEEVRSNVTVTSETVEIEYVADVTNFKLELVNIKEQSENEIELSDFVIENTKSISNVNNVENLNYLQENITYLIDETAKTAESKIIFKDTTTRASLTVDNTEWVVGQANTVKYTITLDTTTEKTEMFVNPMFLIELPSSVESVISGESEFTVNNDNGAFTEKRVFITTVLGRKFAVIALGGEQTVETIQSGNTTIDLTLKLNIAASTTEANETTKLYYQNDTVTAYESGKSFDTAEVTVSLIMESEPKEEIGENVLPEETSNIGVVLTASTQEIVKQGEEFRYNISLYNYDSVEKQNLQLNSTLPEGISVEKVLEIIDNTEKEIEYSFNEETRVLGVNIDKIAAISQEESENTETGEIITYTKLGSKNIEIIVKADTLPEGTFSKEIKNLVKVQDGEKVLAESQEVVNTVSDAFMVVETDNLSEKVNEKEEIVFGVKVTNKGLVDATDVSLKIEVPEEISLSGYIKTVLSEDGQEESKEEGTVTTSLEINNLNVQAKKTYYYQLIGKVQDVEETKQITIQGTVNGEEFNWSTEVENVTEEPENPDDPANPENPDEPTEPDDPANSENPDEPTNPQDPTNPDEPTVPENPTDGENKTDVFDLSLTQYLNKATVTNTEGTTTYDYTETNFAKVEIHSKLMNGSKVTLEYKMIVKNEGTIPGYARKIVDYIPEGLTFNSELNPDWYLGEDGNIYSVTLIDKLLNPGETAELKLVLEKVMTNDNVGTITNLAEICEASNDENIEDINSTPGDRAEGQNDISKVEVMVVTSTGTIILYITLAIAVIAIIGLGFYKVKKVTLNKKGGC